MDSTESACAKFARGFVPVDTEVIVVVTRNEDMAIAMVTTRAESALSSPKDAVLGIAEAYGIAVDDVKTFAQRCT